MAQAKELSSSKGFPNGSFPPMAQRSNPFPSQVQFS